jgi:hypothetical protein
VPDITLGYLTVWPAGETQPVVSTLNSLDGRVKANAAIVGAGNKENGAVSVYAKDTTNVILDLDGYFAPPSDGALAFYPVAPCRIEDTRTGQPLAGGQEADFPVSGLCNIPSSAAAYSLNFTAIPYEPLGYLTVWPEGESQPLVSTLNSPTGTVVANAAMVVAGNAGEIAVYPTDKTDLVIDINGYYAPASSSPGGLSLFTLTPCRVLDTRPNGQFSGTIPVDMVVSSCGLPSLAQTVVINATVVPPGPLGYLTLWPNGQPQPLASTLNAYDGQITSNMAVVPTTNDFINAYAKNPTQLVVDIFSYFATPSGLNGNYTFTINGYNTEGSGGPCPNQYNGQTVGPFMMAGSFMATPDSPFDGNGTVSGVFDLNCAGVGTIQPLNVHFNGSYTIQSNGLGTITITPTLNPSFHLSVAISSTGDGRLILNNESVSYLPNAWGAGAINVQNPAALQQIPSGNFASGFDGVDPNLNRYAGGGVYAISASNGTVSGSIDTNDANTGVTQNIMVVGSLLAPDPGSGRGIAHLTVGSVFTSWVYYITTANELTFLSSDPITSPANLVLQTMLMQSTPTFDNTYLNGVGVVRTSGLIQTAKQKRQPQSGSTDVVLGLFTGDGAGNGSVSLDENNGGILSQQMNNGQYSVASNGRVTLTGFGNGAPPILYLVGKNEAFVLGQDNTVPSGFLVPQAKIQFSNGSAIGTYWGGNYMPVTMEVTDSVVWTFADGNGNLNGTLNYSDGSGTGTKAFTNTYSVDNTGRMTVYDNMQNLVDILYIISPTRVALLPAQPTDTDPSVSVFGSTN